MQFQRRYQLALELIRAWPILDVGGGDGSFLRFAYNSYRAIKNSVCIDNNMCSLHKAKEPLLRIGCEVLFVDIAWNLGLPFPDKYKPTAVALDVLEHLREPELILKEMLRVAQEAVLVVPNFSYWKQRYQVLSGTYPTLMRPSRKHCYWMNPKIVSRLITEAGGVVDEWRYSYPVRLGKIGRLLANKLPGLFAPGIGVRVCKS